MAWIGWWHSETVWTDDSSDTGGEKAGLGWFLTGGCCCIGGGSVRGGE